MKRSFFKLSLALLTAAVLNSCTPSSNSILLRATPVERVIRKNHPYANIKFRLLNETKETIEFGYETVMVQLNWSTDNQYVYPAGPTNVRMNGGAWPQRVKPGKTFSGVVGIAISTSAPIGPLDFYMKLHSTSPVSEKINPSFTEITSNLVHIEVIE